MLPVKHFMLQTPKAWKDHHLSSVLALSAIYIQPFLCTPLHGVQGNKCPWNKILEVACSLNTYTKRAPKVCLATKEQNFILLQSIKSVKILT